VTLRLVLVATAAVLVAGGTTRPASASPAKCEEGTKVLQGQYVRVFCGPARATLVVAGRTYRFRSGECFRSKDFTNVNIGTYTIGAIPVARYIRIVGPSRDGTTRKGAVSWQLLGSVDGIGGARLTLSGKGTKGVFSGRTQSGKRAAGSFTCT
jgi:hypothetical protein